MGPARRVLRRRALRLRAGHHHDGQGHHSAYAADGRRDRLGPGRRALHGGDEHVHARHHVRRPPDRVARSRWPTSTSSSARGSSTTCARTSPPSAPRSTPCATSRSSATSAAPGTSRPSSWSRTGRPGLFDDDESETLLRGFLSGELFKRRAHLPGGRSRRPGYPALAAPDRGPGGVRRDRRRPAPRARGGLRAHALPGRLDGAPEDAHAGGAAARPRLRPAGRRGQRGRARALGPHLRAASIRRPGCRAASCS